MVTDINGLDNLTFSDGKIVSSYDELFDRTFYLDNEKEKIIGFAKFKPFLKTDNRFCNILDINCWYPVTSVQNTYFIKISGISECHFGLFCNILSLPNHISKFSNLKNSNKKIKNYFKRKQKELDNANEYFIRSEKRIEFADFVISEIKAKVGSKVKRLSIVTSYLNGNTTEESFFNKLNDDEFKNSVSDDINYRLSICNAARKLKHGEMAFYSLNCRDLKREKKLITLLHVIKNRDYIKKIHSKNESNSFFKVFLLQITNYFSPIFKTS